MSENPPLQFTNHPCQRQVVEQALHTHYLGITIKRALLVEMSVSQTRSCEHGRTVPISHLSNGGMGGWSKDARRPLSLSPTSHLPQTTSEVGGRSGPAAVRGELFCPSSAAALGRAALTSPRPCGRSGSEGVGVGEQNLREGEVALPLPCSLL